MVLSSDEDLAFELGQLENAVAALRDKIGRDAEPSASSDQTASDRASNAEAIVKSRRRITDFLPASYFGDPAFDMLLDLFLAAERSQIRTVKVCALAADIPMATASRYIDMMAKDGFVDRGTDPHDGRRTLVSLTSSAKAAMDRWLAAIPSFQVRRD